MALREVELLAVPPASEPEPASSAIAIEEIRLRISIVASALAVAAVPPIVFDAGPSVLKVSEKWCKKNTACERDFLVMVESYAGLPSQLPFGYLLHQ